MAFERGTGVAATERACGETEAQLLPPLLAEIGALLSAGPAIPRAQLANAAEALRRHLAEEPADLAAIQLLIQVEIGLDRPEEAEKLFVRTLDLAPGLTEARRSYIQLLYSLRKDEEANRQADILLRDDPADPGHLLTKAATAERVGDYSKAVACCKAVVDTSPGEPELWVMYGNILKTIGRRDESIEAYRKAIALEPGCSKAWWGLAELKTFRFQSSDIEEMQRLLEAPQILEEDRIRLHFTLGKALEDRCAYADSFQHYRKANSIQRAGLRHDPDIMSELVCRMKALFTREFLDAKAGLGCQARDPIFVVGLPRAGSTLIEQILASHSAIEGTSELPVLISIVRRLLSESGETEGSAYAQIVKSLDGTALRALGEEYLAGARIHRKTDRPLFVDKMPSNFHHLGFVHLVLPNAKIIDVRRHPLGCCFSNFRQLFGDVTGVVPSYDLTELGRYYRDYVELMAHFDAVLPGRVHRVFHEDLVRDPETEIRRLLDYCGVPFEGSCLRFHQTERAVYTASSEQVRRPLFSEGVDQWRHYEPWLGPLKKALGPVLTAYPGVPEF